MNNKIHQRGQYQAAELLADTGTIYPGMLLEATTTGVKAQSTSVGFFERMFALEDALQGNTVATVYTVSTPVQIAIEVSGNIVLALCKAGYAYTVGEQVFPYGDGTLRPTTGTPKQLVGTVLVATDLSASGAVDTLVPIRLV